MSLRQNVMIALSHQETDRMPIDFGLANPTRDSRTTYEKKLMKHPGMEGAVGHADVVELSDVLDPEVARVVV